MKVVSRLGLLLVAVAPVCAFADDGSGANWASYLSVGLGIALAVVGASTAQGRIASAFMEGVARNPGAQKAMFVPLILTMALVETLVLFTFLVVNTLAGKFGTH